MAMWFGIQLDICKAESGSIDVLKLMYQLFTLNCTKGTYKNLNGWRRLSFEPHNAFFSSRFNFLYCNRVQVPSISANKGARAMQSKLIRFYLWPHCFASTAILFHSFCLPVCVWVIDGREREGGWRDWWNGWGKKRGETKRQHICVCVCMCVNWFSIALTVPVCVCVCVERCPKSIKLFSCNGPPAAH